jgi:iron complex transport system substrate-binding protein
MTSRRRVWVGAFLALALSAVAAAAATPPRRIVSTAPSITETLFALDLGDRVVGVSQYCRYPEAVLRLPKVGSFLNPNAEAIAHLSPDLVIIHAKADGLAARLTGVGLHVTAVEPEAGLAGVYASITAIGDAAGVPECARALNAAIEARLAEMRPPSDRRPRPRVLLIVGRRPGTLTDIVAAGSRTYLGELIEIAGGANVLDDPALPAYPHLSLESVLRLRPDVVIDTGDMGDTPEERDRNGRANLALWRTQEMVAAAGIHHIHAATTDALVVPGPRVVEAAEWLRGLIHDDVP